jgi:HKD family nuclease
MRQIRQAVSEDCVFRVLSGWCTENASLSGCTIKILSAFVSAGAVEVFEPFFDRFLSSSNRIEMIVGLDLNGTDTNALRRLLSLSNAYHSQVDVRVWTAAQKSSLFHPKLYICTTADSMSAIVGSANFTRSGICNNLESVFAIENVPLNCNSAQTLNATWDMFSNPTKPLKREFLKRLDFALYRELSKVLYSESMEDSNSRSPSRQSLWKIASALPSNSGFKPVSRSKLRLQSTDYMLMDILNETRSTQVQPTAHIMERFFRVSGVDEAELSLQIVTSEGLSIPIQRHVVTSRYMRRIEIPQIRDLPRPCGSFWLKLNGSNKYAYRIITRSESHFQIFDKVLRERNQGTGERRYYLGRTGDEVWQTVSQFIPGLDS